MTRNENKPTIGQTIHAYITRALVTYFSLVVSAIAVEPIDRPDWSVFVQTVNGHVSLIHNITLSQAQATYDALDDDHHEGFFTQTGSEVKMRKIIGPEEWDGCKKAMRHHWIYVMDAVRPDISCSPWICGGCLGVLGGECPPSSCCPDPHVGKCYEWIKCSICGLSNNSTGAYCDSD